MEGGLPSPLGRQAWVPLQFQRAPISQDHHISGSRSCPPPPNPRIILSAAPRLPALSPQIQSSPFLSQISNPNCHPKPEYAQPHLSSPSPISHPHSLLPTPRNPTSSVSSLQSPHLHTPFPIFTSFSLSPFPCLEHPDHSPCHLSRPVVSPPSVPWPWPPACFLGPITPSPVSSFTRVVSGPEPCPRAQQYRRGWENSMVGR